jgi:hypothetical protein
MALRGSAVRRSPHGALAGMLRDLDRRTRRSRRGRAGPQGPAGPQGEAGPRGPRGGLGMAPATVGGVRLVGAAVVLTGEDGRAVFAFDPPLDGVPVVVATPIDPSPSATSAVSVALEEVTAGRVTVRVWRTRPILGLGVLPSLPAGPGVAVHLAVLLPAG